MQASDKEFQWRVDRILAKHAIPREDAIEIVEQQLGRPRPAAAPVTVRAPAAARQVVLRIGNAEARVRVGA